MTIADQVAAGMLRPTSVEHVCPTCGATLKPAEPRVIIEAASSPTRLVYGHVDHRDAAEGMYA